MISLIQFHGCIYTFICMHDLSITLNYHDVSGHKRRFFSAKNVHLICFANIMS